MFQFMYHKLPETMQEQQDTAEIIAVYADLERGSRNHLRAFVSQLGARDVAFPRLNAFSFWIFLFGGMAILGAAFESANV